MNVYCAPLPTSTNQKHQLKLSQYSAAANSNKSSIVNTGPRKMGRESATSTQSSTNMDSICLKNSTVYNSYQKANNKNGILFSSTQTRLQNLTNSSPDNNAQLFDDQNQLRIKTVIKEHGSAPRVKKEKNESMISMFLNHFSPRAEGQQPQKSRAPSIHTNAYQITDAEEEEDDCSPINRGQFGTMNLSNNFSLLKSPKVMSPNNVSAVNGDKSTFSRHVLFDQTDQTHLSDRDAFKFESTNVTLRYNNSNHQRSQQFTKEKSVKTLWQGVDIEQMKKVFEIKEKEIKERTRMFQKRLVKHGQSIRLRKNLKKKILPVIDDPADIPMNVYYNFVKYSTNLFRKFIQLSKGLRKHLLFHVFESLIDIEEKFENKYENLFRIDGQYLHMSPISFGSEFGVRLDIVLKVKLLAETEKFEGKSLIVGCNYKLEDEREVLYSQYQMDLQKALAPKWMWVHKDERFFHGCTDTRGYSTPIIPVKVGDQFELSLTLFSLQGALDMKTVTWNDLKLERVPDMKEIQSYNRVAKLTADRDYFEKYFADLRRVCELEDTVVEWHHYSYINTQSTLYHITKVPDLAQFRDQFDIVKVEVGGIDFSVWKIHLRVKQRCIKAVYKHYFDLRMGVHIIPLGAQTCNEVKRRGFLIDRGEDLQLSPKDELIVYISLGGFEK